MFYSLGCLEWNSFQLDFLFSFPGIHLNGKWSSWGLRDYSIRSFPGILNFFFHDHGSFSGKTMKIVPQLNFIFYIDPSFVVLFGSVHFPFLDECSFSMPWSRAINYINDVSIFLAFLMGFLWASQCFWKYLWRISFPPFGRGTPDDRTLPGLWGIFSQGHVLSFGVLNAFFFPPILSLVYHVYSPIFIRWLGWFFLKNLFPHFQGCGSCFVGLSASPAAESCVEFSAWAGLRVDVALDAECCSCKVPYFYLAILACGCTFHQYLLPWYPFF